MLIMKIITGLIIICGCTWLGFLYSNKFTKRIKVLKQFIHAFSMLETHINYNALPLAEAFSLISEAENDQVSMFFKKLTLNLHEMNSISLNQIWNRSFNEYSDELSIDKEDQETIIQLGSVLGTSDCKNQIKNIELCIYQLKNQLIKAEKIRQKNSGLFEKLGIICGMMIFILLL